LDIAVLLLSWAAFAVFEFTAPSLAATWVSRHHPGATFTLGGPALEEADLAGARDRIRTTRAAVIDIRSPAVCEGARRT
jgi:hypothetical protein